MRREQTRIVPKRGSASVLSWHVDYYPYLAARFHRARAHSKRKRILYPLHVISVTTLAGLASLITKHGVFVQADGKQSEGKAGPKQQMRRNVSAEAELR